MKAFISYMDDDREIKGMFDLVEQTPNYIKIKSNNNIITIPYHKVNKVKLKGGK